MAEEDEKEADKKAEGDGKRGVPVWLWVILLAVLQVILTAAGFYFLVPEAPKPQKDTSLEPEMGEEPEEKSPEELLKEELAEGEELLGAIYPLEIFIVNLKDVGFIRVEPQLLFKEREIPRIIYSRMPLIRDAIIAILAQKERKQILSRKGRAILRKDIQTVINDRLRKDVVKDVLFTQYLVR